MKNLNQLSKDLEEMENKIIKRLVEVQRQSAYDICMDAKKLAPKETGRYADSIVVGDTVIENYVMTTRIYSDAKVVSLSGNEYLLGFLLENGTAPHMIYPINAEYLHFLIDGEDIYAKKVHHPGFVAMPHFIPALNANKCRYESNIKKAVRSG